MGKLIEILHADKKYGIGKKNTLMFSLPQDMAFFRKTTLGHTVAMGENTLLSFPHSKPLKNRLNIVLSQDPTHNYEGVKNVHTLEEFKKEIQEELTKGDVYIIGGASIYRTMLPYVDEVLLTKVDADGGAEVFFPNLDENPSFECIKEGVPILDNGYTIRFTTYINKNKEEL